MNGTTPKSDLPKGKKRLFLNNNSMMESPGQSSAAVSPGDGFKVFVKLKPPPKGLKLVPSQLKLYQIFKSSVIVNLEDAQQDPSKNVDVVGKRFQFQEAFGGGITQKEVFERAVKPQVMNLMNNQDGAVMAYGSTNSGKSHSLQGPPADPGLIFRALEMIFTQIEPSTVPNYRPTGYNTVETLDSEKKNSTAALKKRILSPLRRDQVNPFSRFLERIADYYPGGLRLGPQHEVWMSCLEIREENYWDLLLPEDERTSEPLEFHINPKGQTFVKGLTHLHVMSVAEARDVLVVAKINSKRLNSMRSNPTISTIKSHCIFNVILLKYQEMNNPRGVQMSRISFCDLAAHQESPVIEPSLLALLKSLRALYLHLGFSNKSPEYFTPSKLTGLFRNPLTGSSSLSLIVHVNPDPGAYKDTHAVLHSTAITTEILTKVRIVNPLRVRTSLIRLGIDEDFSHDDNLTAEKVEELLTSFKLEQEFYRHLHLNTTIQTTKMIIEKYTLMMNKIDKCIRKKLEATPSGQPEDPEVVETRKTCVDNLKSIFQYLEENKSSKELRLADDEEELREISSRLPPGFGGSIPEGVNPEIFCLRMIQKRKDQDRRMTDLSKSLNEAGDQLGIVHRGHLEIERKLGEVERKYVGLKVLNDMDGIINRHVKDSQRREDRLQGLRKMEDKMELQKERLRIYGNQWGISFDDWVEMEQLGEDRRDFDDEKAAESSGDGRLQGLGALNEDLMGGRAELSDDVHEGILQELAAELETPAGTGDETDDIVDEGKEIENITSQGAVRDITEGEEANGSNQMHLEVMEELETRLESFKQVNQEDLITTSSMGIHEAKEEGSEVSDRQETGLDTLGAVQGVDGFNGAGVHPPGAIDGFTERGNYFSDMQLEIMGKLEIGLECSNHLDTLNHEINMSSEIGTAEIEISTEINEQSINQTPKTVIDHVVRSSESNAAGIPAAEESSSSGASTSARIPHQGPGDVQEQLKELKSLCGGDNSVRDVTRTTESDPESPKFVPQSELDVQDVEKPLKKFKGKKKDHLSLVGSSQPPVNNREFEELFSKDEDEGEDGSIAQTRRSKRIQMASLKKSRLNYADEGNIPLRRSDRKKNSNSTIRQP
uniref:KIF20B protein n=1 Tax=Fopius arisanus TaxID=64838 RepID=A0A0C9RAN1_9HYME